MKIEVPSFVKGLIFDCDGTLVDSMPLHMKAWEYAVTRGGAVWDYDFFFSKKGMQEGDIVDLFNRQNLNPLNSVATVEAKHTFFKNHRGELKPIKPKPSPDIFLEAAARLGVPPNLCQVFEDGDLGLEAAQKVGMIATDVRPFLISAVSSSL